MSSVQRHESDVLEDAIRPSVAAPIAGAVVVVVLLLLGAFAVGRHWQSADQLQAGVQAMYEKPAAEDGR